MLKKTKTVCVCVWIRMQVQNQNLIAWTDVFFCLVWSFAHRLLFLLLLLLAQACRGRSGNFLLPMVSLFLEGGNAWEIVDFVIVIYDSMEYDITARLASVPL